MVVICHGGIIENGGGGGGSRVFEEEIPGRGFGIWGTGDAVIELFDDIGLVLGPGDVKAFAGEETWNAFVAEEGFVVYLGAGQEGAVMEEGEGHGGVIDAWSLRFHNQYIVSSFVSIEHTWTLWQACSRGLCHLPALGFSM